MGIAGRIRPSRASAPGSRTRDDGRLTRVRHVDDSRRGRTVPVTSSVDEPRRERTRTKRCHPRPRRTSARRGTRRAPTRAPGQSRKSAIRLRLATSTTAKSTNHARSNLGFPIVAVRGHRCRVRSGPSAGRCSSRRARSERRRADRRIGRCPSRRRRRDHAGAQRGPSRVPAGQSVAVTNAFATGFPSGPSHVDPRRRRQALRAGVPVACPPASTRTARRQDSRRRGSPPALVSRARRPWSHGRGTRRPRDRER